MSLVQKVSELAKIIDAKIIGQKDLIISQIFYDTRTIIAPENGIFLAIKGNRNGEQYIEEAYQKSIRIFMTTRVEKIYPDAVYLIVENTLSALQKWVIWHRAQLHFPIIGITGSNGKTILKEWLYQCLWENYKIAKSPKSYNSQLGLPLSVLSAKMEENLGIFEVGISAPYEMKALETILKPEIGILTNVLSAHSEFFTDKKQLILEKIALFENSSLIIYNNTDKEIENELKRLYPDKKMVSFGTTYADIQLLETNVSKSFLELTLSIYGKKESFLSSFKDEASIQNLLCLIAVLIELGYSTNFIKEKILKLHAVSMRMELIKGNHNNLLINDSFNSDLKSLEIALNFLSQQTKAKKELVLTDIFESGIPAEKLYPEMARLVNLYHLDFLYLIGDQLKKYQNLFITRYLSFSTSSELSKFFESNLLTNSTLLFKGARKFQLEKIVKQLEYQSHDTVLEIDLHALISNVNYFKSQLKNPNTKMVAMIKASAYGLGSYEIAEELQYYRQVDYLAVAFADEGVFLREKGIYLPILVMNPEVSSYDTIIDNKLEPEIYSFRVLQKFIQKLKEKSYPEKYPIHIKINTGMNRLGFSPNEVNELNENLKNNPFIVVKSIFSHFATSDVPDEKEFVHEQAINLFKSYRQMTSILGYKPFLHISNTAAITAFPKYQWDIVRLGLGMYGYAEDDQVQKKLKNVINLKTVISNIHTLQKGETVGYGRKYKVKKETRIAVLPIGYADGIRRLVGNEVGYVCINEKKAPIIGSVCMDMLMVNITNISCQEGDPVIIMGEKPSVKEYAKWCQTIPYEILTAISPRVKRVFYRE